MGEVAINTCICNATRNTDDPYYHSGVWIDHVTWYPPDGAFTCRGRSIKYRIICSQRRLTTAGLNINALNVFLILLCMLLLILLILTLRKLHEYKKRLEQQIEKLEDIKGEPKNIIVITLEGNQTSNQVIS